MASNLKHIHTYKLRQRGFGYRQKEQIKVAGELSFQCIDPNCTHFAPYSAILGKNAMCPDCQEVYVLKKSSLTLVLPKCPNCRNTRESRNNAEVRGLVESVITNMAHESKEKMVEKQKKAVEDQKGMF